MEHTGRLPARRYAFADFERARGKERAGRNGRRSWTPHATLAAEKRIKTLAAILRLPPIDGPARLKLRIYVVPPVSWSKKRREAAMLTRPTVVPDVDNVAKLVKDALNGIWWADDRQVSSLPLERFYGPEAGLWVEAEPIPPMTKPARSLADLAASLAIETKGGAAS